MWHIYNTFLSIIYTLSLEQELDEARRKHEEKMAAELLRQQSKAQDELDQVKEQADQKLIQQRSQYEDRLQELEKLLVSEKRGGRGGLICLRYACIKIMETI